MPTKKTKKAEADDKPKKSKESDADFINRIQGMMAKATAEVSKKPARMPKEYDQVKAGGAQMAAHFKEIEECDKIAEEFKKNPPLLTARYIGDVCVERHYDVAIEPKIALLKKNGYPFYSVTNSTRTTPIFFEAFGNAYIKRGAKKVFLPASSRELPFIIRDGDIIGTENRSFVIDLKDEEQDEENNYWHIFIFPNSELKIFISEKTSHPEAGYMDPSQVPDIVKRKSSSTVHTHKIEKVELLSGLFNIRVKKKGRDVNNLVEFASGYPKVEFSQSGGLMNEIVKKEMERAVSQLGGFYLSKVAGALSELKANSAKKGSDEINANIELNKDGTAVIFGTTSRVSLAGSGKMTKKISADPYNPVKITVANGTLYESDGKTNPDPRVSAITKMWLSASQYIISSKMKSEAEFKQSGRSLDMENAKKLAEYAKTLGDKDMEIAASAILKRKEVNEASMKGALERSADTEGQKKGALEALKYAEDSGDKELIEVAKIQLKNIEGGSSQIGYSPAEVSQQTSRFVEETLGKTRSLVETNLPPYNHPSAGDIV